MSTTIVGPTSVPQSLMDSTTFFGLVRLRGEQAYELTLPDSTQLTSSSVYEGSSDAVEFTVSD